MVRTFTPYVPTVLKLPPEHIAKVPEGLKIHFNRNRVPQKNGSTYVTERAYYIDPKTYRPRAIASVKIGVIPPSETEMVASASRRTAKKPAAKPSAMGNLAQKLNKTFNICGIAVSREPHAVDTLHFRNNTGNPSDRPKHASVNGLK